MSAGRHKIMKQITDLDSADSTGSAPGRGILTKMALAGITTMAAGALGVAGVAAATAEAPSETLPMDIPMVEGRSLTLDDLTAEVKSLVGIEDHNNMEEWGDCPACGMG